jgi:hypothetical protein
LHNYFLTHGYCLTWDPVLLWVQIVSNAIIALAYYLIPIALMILARHNLDRLLNWFVAVFATFIFACGTTHVIDIIVFFIPLYWLQGIVLAFTALVSLFAAGALLTYLPTIISLLADPITKDKLIELHKNLMVILKESGNREP